MAARAVVVGESLVDVLGAARVPGGSPLNVAVGLSRLGVATTLVTELGDDDDGARIRAHAAASGVDVRASTVARTSTATAHIGADGAADYDFELGWTLAPDPDDVAGAELFHCGSIAAFLAPGAAGVDVLLDAAVASGAFTSFDPNVRPALLPDATATWARTREIAARCDLVKLSDEDAVFLAPALDGTDGAEDPVGRVARALLSGRTRLVVVTRGAHGCLAVGSEGELRVPAGPPLEVADTVGAGDSFMAALLAGVAAGSLPGVSEAEALVRYADAAARITVTRTGADPPWRGEL